MSRKFLLNAANREEKLSGWDERDRNAFGRKLNEQGDSDDFARELFPSRRAQGCKAVDLLLDYVQHGGHTVGDLADALQACRWGALVEEYFSFTVVEYLNQTRLRAQPEEPNPPRKDIDVEEETYTGPAHWVEAMLSAKNSCKDKSTGVAQDAKVLYDTLRSFPHQKVKAWPSLRVFDRLLKMHPQSAVIYNHDGLEKILRGIVAQQHRLTESPPIICFEGPHGIGKTTIGKIFAELLQLPVSQISLAGFRNPSQLLGSSQTYIKARPGRLLKALVQGKCLNPVVLFDEIDKVASVDESNSTFAFVDIFDPQTNSKYYDDYLHLEIDISKVFFICTANDTAKLPVSLTHRMLIIRLEDYSLSKKAKIGESFIRNSLSSLRCTMTPDDISSLSYDTLCHTRGSGVRKQHQEITKRLRDCLLSLCDADGVSKTGHKDINCKSTVRDSNELPTLAYERSAYQEDDQQFQSQLSRYREQPGIAMAAMCDDLRSMPCLVEAIIRDEDGAQSDKFVGVAQLTKATKDAMKRACVCFRSLCKFEGCRPRPFFYISVNFFRPIESVAINGPSLALAVWAALHSLHSNALFGKHAFSGEVDLNGHVHPVGRLGQKKLALRSCGCTKLFVARSQLAAEKKAAENAADSVELVPIDHVSDLIKFGFKRSKQL
eukprot:m.210645 g.210645  ORF g.210645 m.210645 type:complete len:661 (+) comp10738_c0_seq1:299-2281(+)